MRGVLDCCYQIEVLTGEIYRKLAAVRTYSPRVRETFEILAGEERDHARQIDLVRQTADHELRAVAMVSAEKLDEALDDAERLHREVVQTRLDEEKALRLAVALEQKFVGVHAGKVLHFDNPRLEALFDQLGRADNDHLDTLRNCLAWWQQEQAPQS